MWYFVPLFVVWWYRAQWKSLGRGGSERRNSHMYRLSGRRRVAILKKKKKKKKYRYGGVTNCNIPPNATQTLQ
ncbi:hypothetical protein ASPVEDRAFT_531134 [Aspergillus versicolor CBS 583.65]|uniref:Secreted protein n=1 Tax=Aspergillus versicolor CBS 583.65 TaxID=1036611 RepID=A0A1L9PEF0_ASPVE|nr:uncharacterized protein ASPVEDRAFT_531134 [Aspergillus versicolor CBS 583.65]OJI99897.1 hypothetical protein ASPVEDRAFT_531134 [Aspergillus versicolor CBS 583.65]